MEPTTIQAAAQVVTDAHFLGMTLLCCIAIGVGVPMLMAVLDSLRK